MSAPIESTELFAQLLATLEAHGAATVEGFQIKQEALADLAGFTSKRHLYPYLKKAKAHGLITVTPQARGTAGNMVERLPDRYHLKVTAAEWAERREEVVAGVLAVSKARRGAASRVVQMERSRLVKAARRREGPVPTPAPVEVDPAAIAVRVAQMGPDEDLTGW